MHGARVQRTIPWARARKGKALSIERVYTTEGVHPYDAVTWERRDVVQTNWIKWQGLIPKRQSQLASEAAEIIEREILQQNMILKEIHVFNV